MKLWIDGQCFQSASRSRGIGRYAIGLIQALVTSRPDNELIISLNSNDTETAILAHDLLTHFAPEAKITTWHGVEDGGEAIVGQTTHRILSHQALLHHVSALQPDVALSVSPFEGLSEPFTPFLPPEGFEIPSAAIFYDAIPKRLKSVYLNGAGIRSAFDRRFDGLKNFDRLLAISEYSKREAQELIIGANTTTIGTGLDSNFLDCLDLPIPENVPHFVSGHRSSILYVGGLDYRKNLLRAIQAISKLDRQYRSKVELIIVGTKQQAEIDQLLLEWARAGLAYDQIKIFGYATNQELSGLYRACDLLIQPSLLEGFGLTALEALAAGTPALVSNTGALPEVVVDESLMFDPEDVESIASKIRWAIENAEFVKSIASRESKRARTLTWGKVAERASDVLDEIKQNTLLPTKRLDDVRQASLNRFGGVNYNTNEAAVVLSAAEPETKKPGRFLVDITSTARIDHKSGIQRVVRNMCTHLGQISKEANLPEPILIGTDSNEGFFPTRLDGGEGVWDSRRDERIYVTSTDTILMVDSSWEFYAQHEDALRVARINGTKIVSVLYDLVPAMTPAFCDPGMPTVFVPWLKSCLSYSHGIVCISKAVADELFRLLKGINYSRPLKIGYWHLGADFSNDDLSEEHEKTSSKSHFLAVGTLEPRKGYELILTAFSRLWSEGEDVHLTLVGRMGWGMDEFCNQLQRHPEFGSKLNWLQNVSDDELAEIYSRSSALIAASYREGFGLPIIEAAHRKLPVIASDLDVFKEVAGKGSNVQYFKSGDAESLTQAVLDFAQSDDQSFKDSQMKSLSWRESARALHDVVWKDDWYLDYVPDDHPSSLGQSYFKNAHMKKNLTDDDRSLYSIDVIGNPHLLPITREIKITFRVQNHSEMLWASKTSDKASNGVVLAGMLLNSEGDFIGQTAIYSEIPFVVPPGEHAILSLQVPIDEIQNGAVSVVVDMMQKTVGLFGKPIELSLLDCIDNAPISDLAAFQKVYQNKEQHS